MSYVVVNAIEVPPERRDAMEDRFANRAGEVSKAPGFEAFELLRPSNEEAGDRYLVYTRWSRKEDFEKWMSSAAFGKGHSGGPPGQAPVATSNQVWMYEVVQQELV